MLSRRFKFLSLTALALISSPAASQMFPQSVPQLANPGLRIPSSPEQQSGIRPNSVDNATARLPGFSPDNVRSIVPNRMPSSPPGFGPAGAPRLLVNPTVSARNIGFFNPTNQQLSFIVRGTPDRLVVLAPSEVLTIEVGGDVNAVIQTGTQQSNFRLSAGQIYSVRPNGDIWELAQF